MQDEKSWITLKPVRHEEIPWINLTCYANHFYGVGQAKPTCIVFIVLFFPLAESCVRIGTLIFIKLVQYLQQITFKPC